jgi:hypothetical protein
MMDHYQQIVLASRPTGASVAREFSLRERADAGTAFARTADEPPNASAEELQWRF